MSQNTQTPTTYNFYKNIFQLMEEPYLTNKQGENMIFSHPNHPKQAKNNKNAFF